MSGLCHSIPQKPCRSCRTLGTLGTKNDFEVTVSVIMCEILALLALVGEFPLISAGLKIHLLSGVHPFPSQMFIIIN